MYRIPVDSRKGGPDLAAGHAGHHLGALRNLVDLHRVRRRRPACRSKSNQDDIRFLLLQNIT